MKPLLVGDLTHDTLRVFKKTLHVQTPSRPITPEALGPGLGPGECSELPADLTCSPGRKTEGRLVFPVAFYTSGKSTVRRAPWGPTWWGHRYPDWGGVCPCICASFYSKWRLARGQWWALQLWPQRSCVVSGFSAPGPPWLWPGRVCCDRAARRLCNPSLWCSPEGLNKVLLQSLTY